jgi:formylglycine-generating enzyme required for sulfatase activity
MSQCVNPSCLHENSPTNKCCNKCGTRFLFKDRYRAVKYISEGGFGRTFKAIDEQRLNTICVIKEFLPQLQNANAIGKATELFQQEAVRLQELGKHPRIPDLLAYFEQDGRLYLVQEFIDGQDLLKKLQQNGKFSEQQIRQLLLELLPVLDFIHQQQVIHRDIKPENIIRDKNGSFVLIDFGVSKQLSAAVLTQMGSIVGTLGYAAPEQMQGHVFPASDLYSLGVTCVRLLTGCLPYEKNGTLVDEIFNPMSMTWVWRRQTISVSNELGQVLDKILSIPVGNRYQSAAEVLQALNPGQFSSTKTIPTPNSPSPPPPSQPVQSFTEDLGHQVELEMVYIRGGIFTMGAPSTEESSSDAERPQHKVAIKPFLMGKYPITQIQWLLVANLPKIDIDLNPNQSNFKGNNRPVEQISWDEAVEFCARLSKKTKRSYRLPSEAEWEYACRAGTETPFYFGSTINTDQANYNGNHVYGSSPQGQYQEQTTDVGSFAANAFGLYDLHGNVWEWCADPWHENYHGAPADGRVWDDNDYYNQSYLNLARKVKHDNRPRLLRGGSWGNNPKNCRSANRLKLNPGDRNYSVGCRVVLSFV